MSSIAYTQLIEHLCELAGVADVTRVVREGCLEIEDVLLSVFYFEADEGDRLLLYCDYGVLPHGNEETASERLLEVNMLLSAGVRPMGFALNPDNGNAVLAWRMALEGLTAADLLNRMNLCVRLAQQWRRDHFLEGAVTDFLAQLDTDRAAA